MTALGWVCSEHLYAFRVTPKSEALPNLTIDGCRQIVRVFAGRAGAGAGARLLAGLRPAGAEHARQSAEVPFDTASL